jgi:hypothetical protein
VRQHRGEESDPNDFIEGTTAEVLHPFGGWDAVKFAANAASDYFFSSSP